MPETPTLAVAGRAYSGIRPVLNRLVYKDECRSVTAIKLRKKLPLLLERVGVRRIKIRKKALFDPLILAFSRREKGLCILNLMAVVPERGTDSVKAIAEIELVPLST